MERNTFTYDNLKGGSRRWLSGRVEVTVRRLEGRRGGLVLVLVGVLVLKIGLNLERKEQTLEK